MGNKGVLGNKSLNNNEEVKQQIVQYQHTDDSCPNMESIKKLKGEIKRLR
jgi:hypothetical protein